MMFPDLVDPSNRTFIELSVPSESLRQQSDKQEIGRRHGDHHSYTAVGTT